MKKQRDLSFDFIKGILIFLVVFGHCLNELHVRHTDAFINIWIYSFHMPLFMFICGYFASHTLNKGKMYTIKKMTGRLIIPALVWSSIIFFEKLSYGEKLSPRLFYNSCRGAWFLWGLVGLYFLTVLMWNTRNRIAWISVTSIVLYILWPYYPIDVLKHFKIIQYFPIFCLGGICKEHLAKQNRGGK